MSELDGPGLAAIIGALGVALVALLTALGKASKWVITTVLAEAHKTIDAKNTEIAELDKRLSRCERDRERLRTAREAS